MSNNILNIQAPNDAWILHREEIETIRDGYCNIYALLDAHSGFCFGQEVAIELPDPPKIIELLHKAYFRSGIWPKKVIILRKDPYAETLLSICEDLKINFEALLGRELQPYTQSFRHAFRQFKQGNLEAEANSEPMFTEVEEEEMQTFIPDAYDLCPCASGKKFKFCCQKAFKDITFAMCEAEDRNLKKALYHMDQAALKIGKTAEIMCRYAICWSFFDAEKFLNYLNEALRLNPNHPRSNYLKGISAASEEKFEQAINFYKIAIEHYPEGDRFHLNETYNNLGTSYYNMKCYKEAKKAWEQALIYLPTDEMVKKNLYEFIYENTEVPIELRTISPFIKRYLDYRSKVR